MKRTLVPLTFCLAFLVRLGAAAEPSAKDILEATGVKGGLVVHLGCGDGRLTAALHASDAYLVHGLDPDPANVQKARTHIKSLRLYGRVAIDRFIGNTLPYADNLVNLVVCERPSPVPRAEMMRVLAPGGVAYLREGGKWTKVIKPRPKELDEWTHALHGPDNNAVAKDSVVGPPRHLQWVADPKWARSHDQLASIGVVVTSGGRLFYIVDEGPTAFVALPPRWRLVARDAFSGVLLWKRPIAPWEGHLRHFRSGPPELQRRLVAVGDVVYVTLGYGKPVTALDAATGKTIRQYGGTEDTCEIVCSDGVLYLVAGKIDRQAYAQALRRGAPSPPPHKKRVMAVEATTGKILWKKADADTAEVMPTTLAVGNGKVFFQNPEAIVCLHARSGKQVWRTTRKLDRRRLGWSTPTLVYYKGVVLSADHNRPASGSQPETVGWNPTWKGGVAPPGELVAYSAKTRKRLWSCPAREGYNAPVDVLVAGGLVWTGNLVRASEPGITAGRDPFTGEIKKRRPPDSKFFQIGMGHHRCYRNKATNRYLVMNRAGIEFVDLATGVGIPNHWVRGVCQYGVVPANGLVYAPSHSCACYIHAKLNGFNALAATGPAPTKPSGPQLERGPAYDRPLDTRPSPLATPDDWPTLRHDNARSGCTTTQVPPHLQQAWRTRLGGRLTSLVVAGGRVFVASKDTHTVHALDAAGGKLLWSYTTGGRVDSPPTWYRGTVLFGSADGWVYCLRASDGEPVWRFRAAPRDLRIVAYDQVESLWPVHGNVLVLDDQVYFAAGRSSFLDRGIFLYRLEARSGKLLSVKRLDDRDPKTGYERKGFVRGTDITIGQLTDILTVYGGDIYMRQARFDRQWNKQPTGGVHLYCSAGLLDDTWWHRTYWLLGTRVRSGYGGWPVVGNQTPAGRILCVADDAVYGFRRGQYSSRGAHVGLMPNAAYRLFAADKQPRRLPPPKTQTAARGQKNRRRRPGPRATVNYRWTKTVPLLVRAMVLAGKTLFIAGPPWSGRLTEETTAALEGRKGGVLWAVAPADGSRLAQLELGSPPVFDGMAAAGGRLFLATMAGEVVCLK